MNSFKKLRKIFGHLKPSSNELYIYMPLSDNKNGYIIEYYYQKYYQLFYYKYKESESGTLTKYGYLVVDAHDNNHLYTTNTGGSNNSNNNTTSSNNSGKNQRNYSNNSNNNSNASVNKSLWSNKDKECIFYQTVADKTQIDLENRWMELLRKKERLDIKVVDGNDNNGFSGEYQEWNQLMQHNNDFLISDCIQRRRLDEVFGNLDSNIDKNNYYLKGIGIKHEKLQIDEIDNSGSVNFDKIKPKLPSLSTSYQSFTQSSSSPTTCSPLMSPTSSPLPPSSPALPPSSPSTPPTHSPISPPMSPKLHSSTYLSEGVSSLSTPKNPTPSKNRTMENQGPKKNIEDPNSVEKNLICLYMILKTI